MYEWRTKRRFDVSGSGTAPPPPPVREQDPWPREREDEPIPLFDHFDDPRKAVKSSKCRNRVISNSWDDYNNIFEWLKARVSRCRCSSRWSVRASSPSAAGPSRQRRDNSQETSDETTDED
ncbi:hypothetical protein F2Q69_00034624 [Brassica cretica]|uniref:Uncharacterized protein n=1 Tax=Brassica cretica TaxID=69181 RepID=A0A8S9SMS4_BRACR|nr:hypothetical protein F2Q69_00034624 [Brassica cretica]